MSVITLLLLTTLSSASPRSAAALAAKRAAAENAPLGFAFDLSSSLSSRPERSKGGADLQYKLGLRGAYLWCAGGRRGVVVGGELALRSFLPETDGPELVRSELFQLGTQLGGLVGYRWATRTLTLMPHASAGLTSDFVLVHLKTPGNEAWRPRWLPGPYLGGGLIGTYHLAMLRLDAALGLVDSRPEYRFDLGLGVSF